MTTTTSFDFKSSISEILNVSGLGILILDDNQNIIGSNGQFARWSGFNQDDLTGQSWMSLPLETGDDKGELYCLFNKERSQTLYLQHWRALMPSQPSFTVHFFRPISVDPETRAESQQVAGLPKRPNWTQFLDYEVSRSRRYDNPLAVLKIKLIIFDQPDTQSFQQEANALVSQVLTDELRWADMIGHSESGEFLVILPETPQNAIDALSQKIKSAVLTQLAQLQPELESELLIGESHWQKGDSSAMLLDRARDDLLQKMHALMAKLQ